MLFISLPYLYLPYFYILITLFISIIIIISYIPISLLILFFIHPISFILFIVSINIFQKLNHLIIFFFLQNLHSLFSLIPRQLYKPILIYIKLIFAYLFIFFIHICLILNQLMNFHYCPLINYFLLINLKVQIKLFHL